jgi:hypothetical protein
MNPKLIRTLLALAALVVATVPAHAVTNPCAVTTDLDNSGFPRMHITGSTAKQITTILVNPTVPKATVSIDCNGDGDTADPTDLPPADFNGAFDTYDVQMKGTDTVNFTVVAGTYPGLRLNPQFLMGPGTNALNVTFTGVVLSANSRVSLEIVGGAGNDTMTLNPPRLNASAFLINADTGAGNDVFTINQLDQVLNSDFEADVNLGLGTNTFNYNQSPGAVASAFAGSNVSVSVDGGSGIDVVNVGLKAIQINSKAYFATDLGAGNDKFIATIDETSFINYGGGGEIHLDANGGAGTNVLTVTRNGTTGRPVVALGNLFDVRLKGGSGVDTLTLDLDNLFNLGASGFDGIFRVRMDGGAGNDLINFTAATGAPALATAVHDVVITGGGGTDKLNINYTNTSPTANAAATYGPPGKILIDGFTGLDTCVINTNTTGIINKRDCEL